MDLSNLFHLSWSDQISGRMVDTTRRQTSLSKFEVFDRDSITHYTIYEDCLLTPETLQYFSGVELFLRGQDSSGG